MASCGQCGAALRDGAGFCGSCGAPVAATGGERSSRPVEPAPRCPSCGRSLTGSSQFCGGCGSPRDAASPEASTRGAILYVAASSTRDALGAVLRVALAGEHELLWVESATAVEEVQAVLRERARGSLAHEKPIAPSSAPRLAPIDSVCLVGDDASLPFFRFEDPCGFDEALLSDSPYGMLATPSLEDRIAGQVLPEVPVTRVPFVDSALVRRILDAASHRDRPLPGGWRGAAAVSAAVWREATAGVLRALGAEVALSLSPPSARADVEAVLATRPGRLLFNVHGTDQDAVWLGEGDGHYPEVLRAPGVQVQEGAIVVSEACYGATLRDGAQSIAPSFLVAGAGCFFGSTVIAWGSGPGGPPSLADELAREIYRALDGGHDAAEALARARITLVEAALADGGGLSAPLHNTLLSFVAYGAPRRTVARARPLSTTSKPAPTVASASSAPRATHGSALSSAREQLRRRMTPGAWRVVSSGRVALDALATELRQGATVARTLTQLLGTAPTEIQVVRYRGRRGEHASVLGSAPRATGSATAATTATRPTVVIRRAAVEVGPDGRVTRSFVSR